MRHELPGVLDEVGEQPELGRRERDLLAAQVGAVVVEVDARGRDGGAGAVARGALVAARRRAASTRAVSSGKRQRLGDVVVGAELEAADLVRLRARAR